MHIPPDIFDDVHEANCPGLWGLPCTCTTLETRQSAVRIYRAFFGDLPEASLHNFERLIMDRIRARIKEHQC